MQNINRGNNPIETIFDKLGEILEQEKRALRKMNVDSLIRPSKVEKFGFIGLAVSFPIWATVLLMSLDIMHTVWILALALIDLILIGTVVIYKLIPAWRIIKTPVRQRINEIGKRTIGNWVAGKEIAKTTDENSLNQIELLLKSELEEFQTRANFMTKILKSVNPLLIALAVIFGIFGISIGKGSRIVIAVALFGATANIIGSIIELGLQPEIIRCIQCLSIVEQAKALKERETKNDQK